MRYKEEIAEIHRSMKPFKAAYKDLLAMGMGALARGTKAVEAAKKTTLAEKRQSTDSNVATAALDSKRRKTEAVKASTDFFRRAQHFGHAGELHGLVRRHEVAAC